MGTKMVWVMTVLYVRFCTNYSTIQHQFVFINTNAPFFILGVFTFFLWHIGELSRHVYGAPFVTSRFLCTEYNSVTQNSYSV